MTDLPPIPILRKSPYTGDNKNTGLQLRSSPYNTAPSANENYFYGTFSGADCKVVVHLPNLNSAIKILQKKKNALESERETLLDSSIGDNLIPYNPGGLGYSQKPIQGLRLLEALDYDIAEVENELKEMASKPTTRVLGEMQTISISSFRDKAPVRTLGITYPKGFTRGSRTISGSMIFTMFHQHVLHEILDMNVKLINTGVMKDRDRALYTVALPDQLPPLDISLLFANEHGSISTIGLWGVEFFQEGITISIHDIFSENTIGYVARDYDPMRLVQQARITDKGVTEIWHRTAGALTSEEEIENGHLFRRNPFI